MSRFSLLTLASLMFASPAFAGAQTTTEQIVAFDVVVEAPAIALSARGDGPQPSTEVVAGLEAPALDAAILAGDFAGGAETTTERIAAFDGQVAPARAISPVPPETVAARCHLACACGH